MIVGRYRIVTAVTLMAAVLLDCGRGENIVTTAKECNSANKTCAVEATTTPAATKSPAKNPLLKTTPTGMVRYEVSGNNTDGPAPRETVVIDSIISTKTAIPTTPTTPTTVATNSTTTVAGTKTNVPITSFNVTSAVEKMNSSTAAKNVQRTDVYASGTAAAEKSSRTVVTANTTVAVNATTTETVISVSPPPSTNIGVETVRFVPHKYCYCDLIFESCDINCCCDNDCTNQDMKTFSLCYDQMTSSQIKPESILFDSSLFYVVVDNVPSDYFYPKRDVIESESQVARSLRNRDLFAWCDEKINKAIRVDSIFSTYDLTFKSLRWMYSVMTSKVNNFSEIKTFSLKNSAFDSLCAVEEPIEYLVPKETNCQTYIFNLKATCNNKSSLSFMHYYGEKGFFKVVQPIYNANHKNEKIGLVAVQATVRHRCVSTNGSPYDCSLPEADGGAGRPQHGPVYSGGTCFRAVDAVEYRVIHNGAAGVRGVDVDFYHRDLPDTGRPMYLNQRFEARFARAADADRSDAETYERSGKPGYATGKPVLISAGGATEDAPKDPVKRRRPKPMRLPEPDGRGMCDTNSRTGRRRRSVNFMENVDVRCRVQIRRRRRSERADEPATGATSVEVCRGIQNEAIAVLGDHEGTLVASLGDPDVATWLPVVVVKPSLQPPVSSPPSPPPPPPEDDSCAAVINSVHVRVLYAHVGSFDRPEATVLGVLVNYTAATVSSVVDGSAPAETASDRDRGTVVVAEVPLRATVVFVDLTRPPVRTFAEPPTYEFRLPEDFYYPFWSMESAPGFAPGFSSAATNKPCSKIEFFIPFFWIISHCYQ